MSDESSAAETTEEVPDNARALARRVWANVWLRDSIISFSSPKTLTSVMRSEKAAVSAAIRSLYDRVEHKHVDAVLALTTHSVCVSLQKWT